MRRPRLVKLTSLTEISRPYAKKPQLGGYLHHLEHYFGHYFEVSVLNLLQNLANSHRWQFDNGLEGS